MLAGRALTREEDPLAQDDDQTVVPQAGTYDRPPMETAPDYAGTRPGGTAYPAPRGLRTRQDRDRDEGGRRDLAVAGALLAGGAIGTFVGAKLLDRRRTAHPDDDAPMLASRRQGGDFDVVGRTVTIGKPRSEVYAFWRDFSNLPQVMENVERITPVGGDGGDQNDWVIRAPAGRKVHCRTQNTGVVENERIGWSSLDGSDIDTHGHVTFEDAPDGRGTEVSLTIAYDPPAGEAGRAVAKLFGREPKVQARRDLKRLKMLMETGELATSARRRQDREAGL